MGVKIIDMQITPSNTVKIKFSIDDLKQILLDQYAKESGSNPQKLTVKTLKESTHVESSPGMDPHDADYYDVFDGIEIIVESK